MIILQVTCAAAPCERIFSLMKRLQGTKTSTEKMEAQAYVIENKRLQKRMQGKQNVP